jgi:2-oxoglutarate dehydrogenase E1 component
VLCSGKVYYDIDASEHREKASKAAVARVELLYPFAKNELNELVAGYPNLKQVVWAQEEPQNMGPYKVLSRRIEGVIPEGVDFRYVGRPQRAAPSEGYPAAHRNEQQRIVLTALQG